MLPNITEIPKRITLQLRKELIFIMMTTHTKRPALTELSHKYRIIISIVILFVFCLVGIIVYHAFSTDEYSAKIYDSPDSVETLFISQQESFTGITDILKDNELFDYLYSIDRKSIFGPSIPKSEKYLTEKNYKYICNFLNEYHPYEIGRTGASLHFVFLCKNHDVTLYYTELEGDDLSDFLSYIGQHYKIKSINNNWYIRVNSIDTTRE